MSRPPDDREVEKIVRKVVTEELKRFEKRILERLDALQGAIECYMDGYHGR